MKKLIELKQKTGIVNNALLIEAYVDNLKVKDFNDYQTILFILKAGPLADKNAYRLANTNRKIVDSIYKTEPLQLRVAINNAIVSNTLAHAIATKNINQAYEAANFTLATNRNNPNGNQNACSNLLTYYKGIRDTANFILHAINHYDNYYMKISADSIKKIDLQNRKLAIENSKQNFPQGVNTISKNKFDSLSNAKITTELVPRSSVPIHITNSYGNALNAIAWDFYETGTKNINHLLKAVSWSTRSLELTPNSSYYDTLAHLFYQLNYFEQAIKTQQTAINQAKLEGKSTDNLIDVLKKMKNRTL